jgi:hypothetical protein
VKALTDGGNAMPRRPTEIVVVSGGDDGGVSRVVVKIWPGGDESRREVLGQVAIASVTPDADPASYVAAVFGADGDLDRVAKVGAHPRRDGWAALVSRSLAPQAVDTSPDAIAVGGLVARHLFDGLERLNAGGRGD